LNFVNYKLIIITIQQACLRRRPTQEAVYGSCVTVAIGIFTNKIRQAVLYYNKNRNLIKIQEKRVNKFIRIQY